jgi:hypothetical protein
MAEAIFTREVERFVPGELAPAPSTARCAGRIPSPA